MGQENEEARGGASIAPTRTDCYGDAVQAIALRSLDHVAIAVHDVESAAAYFTNTLGLTIVGDEIAEDPGVRLLYLDAGNTLIQLLEPVTEHAALRDWLRHNGEGLHHICFAVEDVRQCEAVLNPREETKIFRAGRGASAFFLREEPSNVKIEIIEQPPS